MRTLGKHTPLLQSHKKSSSFEFLRNNTFKFTRSIHGFSVFVFSFFFFIIRLVWRNRKSPLKLLKFHRFAQQLATNVSINQDCIKSAKAEPLKYLIMIEHDTVVILNPEPCWEDALSVVLSAIALWNFPWFRVSQFVTSLEPPALTFYNWHFSLFTLMMELQFREVVSL